jgi:hypothetical protein
MQSTEGARSLAACSPELNQPRPDATAQQVTTATCL